MGSGGANTAISNNAALRGGRSFLHSIPGGWGRNTTPPIKQTASEAVHRRLELEFREALRRDRMRSRIGLAAGVIAALVLLAYPWWG